VTWVDLPFLIEKYFFAVMFSNSALSQLSTISTLRNGVLQYSRTAFLNVSPKIRCSFSTSQQTLVIKSRQDLFEMKSYIRRPPSQLSDVRRTRGSIFVSWKGNGMQTRPLHSSSGAFFVPHWNSSSYFAVTVSRHGGITRPKPGTG